MTQHEARELIGRIGRAHRILGSLIRDTNNRSIRVAAARLEVVRAMAHLSNGEIARYLGAEKRTVSRWRRQLARPPREGEGR